MPDRAHNPDDAPTPTAEALSPAAVSTRLRLLAEVNSSEGASVGTRGLIVRRRQTATGASEYELHRGRIDGFPLAVWTSDDLLYNPTSTTLAIANEEELAAVRAVAIALDDEESNAVVQILRHVTGAATRILYYAHRVVVDFLYELSDVREMWAFGIHAHTGLGYLAHLLGWLPALVEVTLLSLLPNLVRQLRIFLDPTTPWTRDWADAPQRRQEIASIVIPELAYRVSHHVCELGKGFTGIAFRDGRIAPEAFYWSTESAVVRHLCAHGVPFCGNAVEYDALTESIERATSPTTFEAALARHASMHFASMNAHVAHHCALRHALYRVTAAAEREALLDALRTRVLQLWTSAREGRAGGVPSTIVAFIWYGTGLFETARPIDKAVLRRFEAEHRAFLPTVAHHVQRMQDTEVEVVRCFDERRRGDDAQCVFGETMIAVYLHALNARAFNELARE